MSRNYELAKPTPYLVEHVRPVGGGQHDDALAAAHAVHLDEQLVEGLLALAAAGTARRRRPRAPYRVHLVYIDNARSARTRLFE